MEWKPTVERVHAGAARFADLLQDFEAYEVAIPRQSGDVLTSNQESNAATSCETRSPTSGQC